PLQRFLGEALFRRQPESPEAGEFLRRSVASLPRDPESRHYYAQWAFRNSRHAVCLEHEEAALKMPGLNDLALLQMHTLIGMCAARLQNAGVAKQAFKQANTVNLRMASYDPLAAMQYVRYLSEAGADRELQEIVGQILKRVPQFGPALLERA